MPAFQPPANDHDVIVVGAGPAGLSVASELAQTHRVLVLDARPDGPRGRERLRIRESGELAGSPQSRIHKSWFSPHDCLFDNPDLLDCRFPHGVKRLLTRTYSGPSGGDPEVFDLAWETKLFGHAPLEDRYPYLDEYKLVSHWEQLLLDRPHQARILGGHRYQDHRTHSDHVEVRFLACRNGQQHPEVQTYRTRLLLDASGHDSDIRKAYPDRQRNVYWWTVFGAIFRHADGEIVTAPTPGHPLVAGDYMMWNTFRGTNIDGETPVRRGRPIVEYEVLDEHTSFLLIFYLRPEKVDQARARDEFLNLLHTEPELVPFKNAEIDEFKYGYYPSGRRFRSYAQDRVDFVGDAGLWTTPCGWGASVILKNYRPYVHRLRPLLNTDRLDQASLRALPKRHGKAAGFFMNTAVTRFLSYGTVDQLDQLIAIFRDIDPIICEKIFTLRADPADMWVFVRAASRRIGARKLIRALPRGERVQLLYDLGQALLQYGLETTRKAGGRQPERGFGVFAEH